tara:strand:+ start:214 stop:393 length:180 start_codon:yes stop_codon:yes gene_type:complete
MKALAVEPTKNVKKVSSGNTNGDIKIFKLFKKSGKRLENLRNQIRAFWSCFVKDINSYK